MKHCGSSPLLSLGVVSGVLCLGVFSSAIVSGNISVQLRRDFAFFIYLFIYFFHSPLLS